MAVAVLESRKNIHRDVRILRLRWLRPARKRDRNIPGFNDDVSAWLSFRTLRCGTNQRRNIRPRMDTVPLRSEAPRQLREMREHALRIGSAAAEQAKRVNGL